MMTEQLERSREWLLFNAVEAWLHHYGTVDRPVVAQYKQLRDELHDVYMQTLHKDAPEPTPKSTTSTRKRTRNASQSSAS